MGSSMLDVVFRFFDEGASSSPEWEEEEELGRESSRSAAEDAAFWDSQQRLLHAALESPRSSLETKVSRATEAALGKIRKEGGRCSCSRSRRINIDIDGCKECRACLLKNISDELRNAGFDCGLCKSKWRSSTEIPSGEHSYLDVVHRSSNGKKRTTRVVIELNFRAEFEVARASERYNQLVMALPEVFVGKPERLKAVIKPMCAAAKRCMKDNNMHMGPWRKYNYMQAKWLASSSERVPSSTGPPEAAAKHLPVGDASLPGRRPRASMLTSDLSDKLPAAGRSFPYNTAVEVV